MSYPSEPLSHEHGSYTHWIPSTPVPSFLIDQVMPTLKDTEWRLLLIIVRQTLGWKSNGKRKAFDWLSHSQLRYRTGRTSEAISRALDALVRKNLVEVWDENGRCLITAAERRRCPGKLLFSLGQAALAPSIDQGMQESEKPTPKSEIRKSKTTKETLTKYLPNGRAAGVSHSDPSKKNPPGIPAQPDLPVRQFLRTYRELFKDKTEHGEPPVVEWGRDTSVVKHLLTLYPYERLVQLLGLYLGSDDPWFAKRGYSLIGFKSAIGQLLVSERRRQLLNPVQIRHGRWSRAAEPQSESRRASG